MADLREFHGPNAAYVLDLYEQYQRDPAAVDERWAAYFSELTPPAEGEPSTAGAGPGPSLPQGVELRKVLAARDLARQIRARGHTAARLDPLGMTPPADPIAEPAYHGLSEADLAGIPATAIYGHDPASQTALAEVRRLPGTYAGSAGYEWLRIPNPDERTWLSEAIETHRYSQPLSPEHKRALLDRLAQVEGFEKFLHRAFFGQKRFSIEGTDLLVPMLDEIVDRAAEAGARDVLIGMAHRGRLNVLTHVLGKPYELMLAGFRSAQESVDAADAQNSDEPSGDVKYHMGW